MKERDKIAPGSNEESKATDPSASAPIAAKSSDLNQRAASQSSTPQTKPPAIPDYELLRRIGGGSYGDVWLARSATGALRALKIVWRHTFEDERPFQREFEGIQRFERLSREHPSQLSLFHVGRGEGYFYYVMELADDVAVGRDVPIAPRRAEESPPYQPHTLRADLAQGRLAAARVLEIGLALTEALSHLHTNGLVHRDVKPSNVIFVNGRPKLADIGLVTDAGDTRSIVGTEGYLAPEGPGTPQADLFALGKVLYEAATGLDRRQLPQLPPDLRDWPDAKLVFELNEIILKACAGDPRQRYQSAKEMQADLALLQRGQSVKRQRAMQARWVAVRRAGLVIAAVATITAGLLLLWHRFGAEYPQSSIPEVNRLVSRGNYCLKAGIPEQLTNAAKLFTDAIALDKTYLPAHWGLCQSLIHSGGMSGTLSSEKELRAEAIMLKKIARDSAESLIANACIKWMDWEFPAALADAYKATQARAASREGRAATHSLYGYFLTESGEFNKALEEEIIARDLYSEHPHFNCVLGYPYFAMRDLTNAMKCFQASTSLESRHSTGHYWIGRVHEETTNFTAAIQEFEQAEVLEGTDDAESRKFYIALSRAAGKGGWKGYWEERLRLAKEDSPQKLYYLATLYARLGDKKQAYDCLRRASAKSEIEVRDGLMMDLCWDHNDPEFQKIARHIHLLQ